MTLENIQKELQKYGYQGKVHQTVRLLIVSCLPEGETIEEAFHVSVDKRGCTCTWFDRQTPVKEEFVSVQKLVDFIRKKFPR